MKKLSAVLICLAILLSITGCSTSSEVSKSNIPETTEATVPTMCSHEWEGAECSGTQTCMLCGETKDTYADHDFKGGSCTESPICVNCGEEDQPLGHSFSGGDCLNTHFCERCGEMGELGEHRFSEPTCTEAGVCSICGEESPALGHSMKDATCTAASTCSKCDYTEGEALGHEGVGKCTRCGEELPIIGSGRGDSVLSDIVLEAGEIYAMRMTHSGYSNFAVWLYDADDNRDLLINEIGNYTGTVFLDGASPLMLNIEADGDWSYEIYKLEMISQDSFSGKGDYVTGIFYMSGGAQSWHFKHSGDSNFAVWLYTSEGRDLVINEIGMYDADQIVSVSGSYAFLVINADGEWEIYPDK